MIKNSEKQAFFGLGPEGRQFESDHPDKHKKARHRKVTGFLNA